MSENVSEPKDQPQPESRRRGDGGIFLRGKIFWIRYSFRGLPKRESSHSTDPEVARKLLNRRMKEVWADRNGLQPFIPKADKVLISELLDRLLDDYKLRGVRSLKSITAHARLIREAFGDRRAGSLATSHVDAFIKRRKEDGMAPATINRELQVLGRAFRLGVERSRDPAGAPHSSIAREQRAHGPFLSARSLKRSFRHCRNTSKTSPVSRFCLPGDSAK